MHRGVDDELDGMESKTLSFAVLMALVLSINVRKGHFEDFWKAALDKKCQVYVAELDNDVKVPTPPTSHESGDCPRCLEYRVWATD